MAKKDNEGRSPRYSLRGSKVPLTYYRSAKPSGSDQSPFKRKEAPAPSKVRQFFQKFTDGVILLILAGVLIYTMLVSSNPNVKVSSEVFHPADTYKQTTADKLDELRNRNKVTLDENGIVNSLEEKFPEISGVQIVLPIFSQTPTINIAIAKPSFVLKSGGSSYVIGSQGRAVADADEFPELKDLPVLEDKTGFPVEIGKQVLSADSVNFINNLVAQSKKANVPIKSLVLPSKAQELNLYTKDKPYYVKFYLGDDSAQQIGQFLATRNKLDDAKSQPKEYLDVRVLGKVFYK